MFGQVEISPAAEKGTRVHKPPEYCYKYTFKTLYRGKFEGPTMVGNYYGRRRRPKSFWVTYDYALLRGSFWHYSFLALLRGGFRDLPV